MSSLSELTVDWANVKNVRPSSLSVHPKNAALYRLVENGDLKENIQRVGILEPLVALHSGVLLSGHRRLQCAIELELKEVPVRFLDVDAQDEELYLVSFNRYRTKAVSELLKEIEVLYEHYGRNQGKRNDLTSVNLDGSKTTREKVAQLVGVSTGQVSKLLKIKETLPLLLPEIDAGKLSINQAYLWCNRKTKQAYATRTETESTFVNVTSDEYSLFCSDSHARLKTMDAKSVSLCFTSPPYYQFKRFGDEQTLGHEDGVKNFISSLLPIFEETFRVLEDGGTLVLNMDEPYLNKRLLGTTERFVIRLLDLGFVLRQKIIWNKGPRLQGSLKGAFTHVYEPLYLFTKGDSMKFNTDKIRAVKEDVEQVPTYFDYGNSKCHAFLPSELEKKPKDILNIGPAREQFKKRFGAKFKHPAQFPPELAEPFIISGTEVGDVVLDPFNGVGNTGIAALRNNRRYIGIDLNQKFLELTEKRFRALR